MTSSACGAARPWDLPGMLRKALVDSGFAGPAGPFGPPGPHVPGRARGRAGHAVVRGWRPTRRPVGRWTQVGLGPRQLGSLVRSEPRGCAPPARPGRPGRCPLGGARAAGRAADARVPDHPGDRRRSDGAWKPSPGSVYPTLQQLEDEGLVRAPGAGRSAGVPADRGRAAGGRREGPGVRQPVAGRRAERGRHPTRRPDLPGRRRVRARGTHRNARADGRGAQGAGPHQGGAVPDPR